MSDDKEQVRVAVCFPSGENVNAQFMLSVVRMVMSERDIPIVTVANCCSSRVAFNRNHLVEQAQSIKATHMLFIDADTIFPWYSLRRLLAFDKDVIGATASRRNDNDDAVGETLDGDTRLQVPSPPIKMKILGLPLMLVKMSVFEKLRAPWFAEPPNFMMGKTEDPGLMPEDEYFCHTALAAGLDIWCDPELSLEIGHRGAKTYYIMKPQPEPISLVA